MKLEKGLSRGGGGHNFKALMKFKWGKKFPSLSEGEKTDNFNDLIAKVHFFQCFWASTPPNFNTLFRASKRITLHPR